MYDKVKVLVTRLYPTPCDPWTVAHQAPLWNSPDKNTGVGCHSLLQGIFLTQRLNPGLLHCRRILYCLIHQGNVTTKQGNINLELWRWGL